MNIQPVFVIIIFVVLFVLLCLYLKSIQRKYPPPTKEFASRLKAYHFGFDTNPYDTGYNYMGPYYTGIYPYTWGGYYGSPYGFWYPSYYKKYIKPYLVETYCY